MLTLCCNTRASFQGGFHEDGQPCQWEILCRADEGGVRRPGGRQVHQLGVKVNNFCAPEETKLNQTQVVNLWAIPSGVGQPGLLGRSLEDDLLTNGTHNGLLIPDLFSFSFKQRVL